MTAPLMTDTNAEAGSDAVLRIVNPSADTEEARECFRRMERELPFDPRAHWKH